MPLGFLVISLAIAALLLALSIASEPVKGRGRPINADDIDPDDVDQTASTAVFRQLTPMVSPLAGNAELERHETRIRQMLEQAELGMPDAKTSKAYLLWCPYFLEKVERYKASNNQRAKFEREKDSITLL